MVTVRTIGTLIVIILFFGYVYAANVYIEMTYFGRNNAGPAVPIQQTIKQITQTVTQYMQIAVIIAIAVMAIKMAIKSKRILGIIPFKDIQKHLLLLGPTGAGKTTIAKKVIELAVRRNVGVTVLDWKTGARAGMADVGHVQLRARPERRIHPLRGGCKDCQEDQPMGCWR